ncbi:MAG: DUF4268 domain-containing protein [Pyrinomonadaceae bacterium]
MYLINKDSNRITKITQKTFSELDFREREHLQEWFANLPESLGEELLIIQKEFDGFNDTRERLDLLALDKQGNLVIIENKLDDTGRDVTWQVLKYASYCSTLTKEQIRKIYQDFLDRQGKSENAEQNIIDFYEASDFTEVNLNNGLTQRIIMVAGNFRKEVTSTVLWLMNYKLRIQCFKVTPFQLGEQLILNVEQIIPMKDAEEFTISMAEKTQEVIDDQEDLKARHYLRLDFWKEFLKQVNLKTKAFQNISPSKDNWLSTGAGMSGVGLNVTISNKYARVEVYISRSRREENKFVFDELFKKREMLETKFGNKLIWERLNDINASRIKFSMDTNYFEKENWQIMIDFMTENYVKLENAFRDELTAINGRLKNELTK